MIDDILARLRQAHDEWRVPNQGLKALQREERRLRRRYEAEIKVREDYNRVHLTDDGWNPPPGPSPELCRQLDILGMRLTGVRAEDAEAAWERNEREVRARIEAEARHPWPRFHTKVWKVDHVQARDRLMITNAEEV